MQCLPLKVSCTPVKQDDDEEHGVEVRDDSGRANDSTPCQTHRPVGDIVGFAGVCPPAAGQ